MRICNGIWTIKKSETPFGQLIKNFVLFSFCRQNELRIGLRERTRYNVETQATTLPHDFHSQSAGRTGKGLRENSIPRYLYAGGIGPENEIDRGENSSLVQQSTGEIEKTNVIDFVGFVRWIGCLSRTHLCFASTTTCNFRCCCCPFSSSFNFYHFINESSTWAWTNVSRHCVFVQSR